jgi:hypothetical protein
MPMTSRNAAISIRNNPDVINKNMLIITTTSLELHVRGYPNEQAPPMLQQKTAG